MSQMTCLILHRKSANEPYVKEAVKSVRKEGIKLRVLGVVMEPSMLWHMP